MYISKNDILSKTNWGLDIYAYILNCFYPSPDKIKLSGHSARRLKNPYNYDKPTLQVEVVNKCAYHVDDEGKIPCGDCFDFAAFFYRMEGDELLLKINNELNLRILSSQNQGIKIANPTVTTSPEFSFFYRPIFNIKPAYTISLLQVYKLISGGRYAKNTMQLQALKSKRDIRIYKANYFDYVTFSGIFSLRYNDRLLNHSNLITIDIDNLENPSETRKRLLLDEYLDTELLFISPSGRGLKWIIPKCQKENHQYYFSSVVSYLKKTYKIRVDTSGKDVSRACFLPHDPNCYINPKYL